jgi:hypothetical protein
MFGGILMKFDFNNEAIYAVAVRLAVAFTIAFSFSLAAFAQSEPVAVNHTQQASATPASKPLITEFRGVTLGMTADQIEDKLGDPEADDAVSLYYVFDKGESLQVALDAEKKVRMIAMIYLGNNAQAPGYAEVFGPAIPLAPAADGRIYNLIRYPEAGYSVTYGRIKVDDKPMTTITIQKIG